MQDGAQTRSTLVAAPTVPAAIRKPIRATAGLLQPIPEHVFRHIAAQDGPAQTAMSRCAPLHAFTGRATTTINAFAVAGGLAAIAIHLYAIKGVDTAIARLLECAHAMGLWNYKHLTKYSQDFLVVGADQPVIRRYAHPLAIRMDLVLGQIPAPVHLAGLVPTAIKRSASLAASTVLALTSLARAIVLQGGSGHSVMRKGYPWRSASTPISPASRRTQMQLSLSICFQ